MSLDEEMEDELYSFIVDSNLEWSLIEQIKSKRIKNKFINYYQLSDDEE